MLNRSDIKDSRNFLIGYSLSDDKEIKYFGNKVGYVGRYDKSLNRYFYMRGSRAGLPGPYGDIGYSEVLKAEHAY